MIHLYLFDEEGRASSYGIGTYIQNVIMAGSLLSISITLVRLKTRGEMEISISENRVRTISIPRKKQRGEFEQKDEQKEYSQYVVSVLKNYISPSDSLIFHLNYTQDYFLAENLKKEWPLGNLVLTIHYFTWCFALNGNYSYLAAIIEKEGVGLSEFEKEVIYSGLFEQQLFRIVDRIICLSHFAEEVLQDYYEIQPEKIVFIPNGLPDLYKEKNKETLRKQYHIPLEEKIVLFVGRLDEIKGVNYLIEAFKSVIKEIPQAHLYVVGDGHFKNYISICNPIWNKITFCGKLSPTQVFEFYQLSDIGVLPSMHEQCSYVAIEMMMYGLPFIGSTSTGLNEMIEDGMNGYKIHLQEEGEIVKVPTVELTYLIIKMLKQQSLNKMAIKSREIYLQKYSHIQMQNKLKYLYLSFYEKGMMSPNKNLSIKNIY